MALEQTLGVGTVWLAILIIFLIILIFAIAILSLVFWIFMIIDCATRKFKQDSEKIVWIIVLVFLHVLGALIYYFVIKRPDKH